MAKFQGIGYELTSQCSRLLVTSICCALVLAGCSAEPPARPSLKPTHPDAGYAVPKIDEPLDVQQFKNDPCALLRDADSARLGLSSAKEIAPTSCRWSRGESSPFVGITAGPRIGGGLRQAYKTYLQVGKTQGFKTSWEPAEISGYPAALTNGSLELKYGMCVVQVGVADDQLLRLEGGAMEPASGQANGTATSCARLSRAASAVIENARNRS